MLCKHKQSDGDWIPKERDGTATAQIFTNIIEYSAFAEYSEVTPICVRSLFMCHLGSLWFLSGDAERNVKKEIKFALNLHLPQTLI